ncbi:hypothetical protein Q7P37_000822 [Cladosporium fusiforme]
MFKSIKRSAASIFRKKKKRTKVISLTRAPLEAPSSASLSSWDNCSRPSESRSPEPVTHRVFEGTSSIEEVSVGASSSEPEGQEDWHESSLEQDDFSATPRQLSHSGAEQGRAESPNSVDAFMAHDPWKVEVLRLVTTTYEGTQHQALLLTTDMLQNLQAIAQHRRELQALDSEIETAIESHGKTGLEIEKKQKASSPAVEKLKAERSVLLAELERLQGLVVDGIVRVVEEGRAK